MTRLPTDPSALLLATRLGEINWMKGNALWKAGAGETWISVSRQGRTYTLVMTHGMAIDGQPVVQRDGWFGRRCALGELWDEIERPRAPIIVEAPASRRV